MTAHERARLVVAEMLAKPVNFADGEALETWMDELVNRVGEIFVDSVCYRINKD